MHDLCHISQDLTGIFPSEIEICDELGDEKPDSYRVVSHDPSLGVASAITQWQHRSLKLPLSFLVGTPTTSKGEANLCSALIGLSEVSSGQRLLPSEQLYCSRTQRG